jgi:hypothetical protein
MSMKTWKAIGTGLLISGSIKFCLHLAMQALTLNQEQAIQVSNIKTEPNKSDKTRDSTSKIPRKTSLDPQKTNDTSSFLSNLEDKKYSPDVEKSSIILPPEENSNSRAVDQSEQSYEQPQVAENIDFDRDEKFNEPKNNQNTEERINIQDDSSKYSEIESQPEKKGEITPESSHASYLRQEVTSSINPPKVSENTSVPQPQISFIPVIVAVPEDSRLAEGKILLRKDSRDSEDLNFSGSATPSNSENSSGICNYSWELDEAGNQCGNRASSEKDNTKRITSTYIPSAHTYIPPTSSYGSTYVRGYVRKDGTYVRGHSRRR